MRGDPDYSRDEIKPMFLAAMVNRFELITPRE